MVISTLAKFEHEETDSPRGVTDPVAELQSLYKSGWELSTTAFKSIFDDPAPPDTSHLPGGAIPGGWDNIYCQHMQRAIEETHQERSGAWWLIDLTKIETSPRAKNDAKNS